VLTVSGSDLNLINNNLAGAHRIGSRAKAIQEEFGTSKDLCKMKKRITSKIQNIKFEILFVYILNDKTSDI
jgi:hypothetical protein